MSSAVIRPPSGGGFTSRSSIFLGRIDPRVKLTAMGRGGGAEGRTQRARWSLMEPYGALRYKTVIGILAAHQPRERRRDEANVGAQVESV